MSIYICNELSPRLVTGVLIWPLPSCTFPKYYLRVEILSSIFLKFSVSYSKCCCTEDWEVQPTGHMDFKKRLYADTCKHAAFLAVLLKSWFPYVLSGHILAIKHSLMNKKSSSTPLALEWFNICKQ